MNSFTLTMWDVKLVIAIGMLENVQFYLNYVGCKVSSSIYKPPRSKGFTLTMWDVKSTKRVVALFKFSFYLNYVGCKGILISPASFGSAQRFYLNYVGCKDYQSIYTWVGQKLFYLNYVGCKVWN